jgi:hypothetical protein
MFNRFQAIKNYVSAMAAALEDMYPALADVRANPPEQPKKKPKKTSAARGRGRGGRGRGGRRAVQLLLPVVPGLPNLNATDTDDDAAGEDGDADGEKEQRGRPPVTWVSVVDKLGANTVPFKRHVRIKNLSTSVMDDCYSFQYIFRRYLVLSSCSLKPFSFSLLNRSGI